MIGFQYFPSIFPLFRIHSPPPPPSHVPGRRPGEGTHPGAAAPGLRAAPGGADAALCEGTAGVDRLGVAEVGGFE